MTAYKITSTTSRFVTSGNAFEDGTNGADSLTVDDGAYLVTTGSVPANGIYLDALGAWTVNINGSVLSINQIGLQLEQGNTALSNITISTSGEIAGGSGKDAMQFGSSANVKNAGTVVGGITFYAGAVHGFTNTGIIEFRPGSSGAIVVDSALSAVNTIVNSGVIGGGFQLFGKSTITNSGSIDGALQLGGMNDAVTNNGSAGLVNLGDGNNKYTATSSASLAGGIEAGAGNDIVSSAGNLGGFVQLGHGNNSLTLKATGAFGAMNAGDGNDTVSIAGQVAVAGTAVDLQDGVNKLTIAATGKVTGDILTGFGDDTIINAGTIAGNITAGAGVNSFSNSGTVTGNYTGGISTDKFTNSKTFTGDVDLGGLSANSFGNSGVFTGDITGGSGNDTFTNSKTITGTGASFGSTIDLGDGLNKVTNGGVITGGLFLGADADKVTNSGTIAFVALGDGDNVLINSGTISFGVEGGSGIDTLTNTGKIFSIVQLYDGNDKYTGGKFAETFVDGAGSDNVKLGGGNDVYQGHGGAGDGNDTIDGGAGIDTYYHIRLTGSGGGSSNGPSTINIDTVAHAEPAYNIVNTAANSASGEVGNDAIIGFENVIGSNGDNNIFGSKMTNVLRGEGGSDGLFGYGGNDILDGGFGIDALVGGAGADKLYGGGADGAADQFAYFAVSDSGVAKAARDIIFDFEDGLDQIWLNLIDANTTNGATDDAFHFIGTNLAFGINDPGALRVLQTATGWTVEGNVNGDAKADFAIDVLDIGHNMTIDTTTGSSDFVL